IKPRLSRYFETVILKCTLLLPPSCEDFNEVSSLPEGILPSPGEVVNTLNENFLDFFQISSTL
ncbi:MAG: hypothetical protein MUR17_01670, partial [Flavobacteriaceae bacterium]|nr:hypothetical protein [Flavobacteriaceae bacterium]